MAQALICIEGVLAIDDQLKGRFPSAAGMRFVGSLSGAYNIVLSSLDRHLSSVEHWLQLNGIFEEQLYQRLLLREKAYDDLSGPEVRLAHLDRLRGSGGFVDLVVDVEAATITGALHRGATGLLWAQASYARGEFEPEPWQGPQPWDEVEAAVTRGLELKRLDERLAASETSEFDV